ncbi:MAG: sulfatase-like hydrolase/transferase, partial [Colwellia sp.]
IIKFTAFTLRINSKKINPLILTSCIPLVAILGIFQLNSYFFPISKHSYSALSSLELYSPASILFLGTVLATLIYGLCYFSAKLFLHKKMAAFVVLLTIASILPYQNRYSSNPDTEQPNIIIIGIDSLRPELIERSMPFLNMKLTQSSIFPNSFTPFARTYPSWNTILSGEFPTSHLARFNLIDERMQNQHTKFLPEILSDKGYYSIYASDERRFSQIGTFQGFDEVLGPRTGLADFILGSYADHPISNLITLFSISSLLLPEIAINRASAHLYKPESFSNYLSDKIIESKEHPLFLSVHFCLAHWPFYFSTSKERREKKGEEGRNPYYLDSLAGVDRQIQALWKDLQKQDILSNSIIIFLSDHGESWNENLIFQSNSAEPISFFSNGHGNNIISNNEHRVLMAFYQGKDHGISSSNATSTLADITPTILDILNIPPPLSIDGLSLKNKLSVNDRVFPVESGFSVSAASSKNIDKEKAAQQALSRYSLTTRGELRLKIEEIPFLLQGKRIGVRNRKNILTWQVQYTNFTPQPSLYLLDIEKYTYVKIERRSDLDAHIELREALCNWYGETLQAEPFCRING